ncbi:ROK family transcriptional regulator [Bacillus sp. CMF12]|uniref:ROK family transcriptional regulator n=1 Tax=Bacillaceae TaxID=186817 RepID=UPI001FB4C086|nr:MULTISPECIES: ROK family transcriptional regulator [Bacillaceae]UOE53730.1 ROK family transcriptional regulator [Cytobacillus oceanisediminis]USK48174.1 ROK family transcriptional regulator [Bacillus sp. CMF12]
MQKGTFQWMKSINKTIVLNKIRMSGPISRAQIAKETNLTPPTVSSIVKELLHEHFVVESQQGQSSGGRKPTMLVLNHQGFYVLGVDVGPVKIRTVLTDLNGKVLFSHSAYLPSYVTNKTLLDLLKTEISNMLKNAADSTGKLLGIGIGMHGVVDHKHGNSLFAPSLNLRNIAIKEELEHYFQVTVRVENDARVMALGETWFVSDQNDSGTVVTINVGNGIGAGIVVDGKLLHGEHNLAGEIGHMSIDLGGSKCTCGNFGCLQTLASGTAIKERALKELTMGKESYLNEIVDGDLDRIEARTVYQAACHGDSLSIDLLTNTGIYLGIGITNLIHLLNPNKIIITGGISNAKDFLLPSIKETVAARALTVQAKNTEIVASKLGEYSAAIGSVVLILSDMFSADLVEC